MPKPVTMDIKQLQAHAARLRSVVKVSNKKGKFMPLVHISIGKEEMNDDAIAENALAVYQAILPALGNKPVNVKSLLVKMTMSAPVKIGGKQVEAAA
jgi:large subunit ribosomal protein L1